MENPGIAWGHRSKTAANINEIHKHQGKSKKCTTARLSIAPGEEQSSVLRAEKDVAQVRVGVPAVDLRAEAAGQVGRTVGEGSWREGDRWP